MDEKLKEIQDLAKQGKIKFAPSPEGNLDEQFDQLRKALKISRWFISKESTISDFCLTDVMLAQLNKDLGITVEHKDYVVDVARRLKEKANQS